LTDKQGQTTFQGLLVVRNGNPAQGISDLRGYRLIVGPAACDEKNAAAVAALKRAGVNDFTVGGQPAAACTDAATQLMKLDDDDRVVAAISDYARILLEGCGSVPPGALRVVGKTAPLPFVTVFATQDLPAEQREAVRKEFLEAGRFKALLKLLETKDGFKPYIAPRDAAEEQVGWTDFRGPERRGLVPALPNTLAHLQPVWTAALDDQGLGGIAATQRWVVITDRVPARNGDCLKVFDASTGRLAVRTDLIRPPKPGSDADLDYGNSVRATPVIRDGRIYVLDAYGTLFVADLPRDAAAGGPDTITGVRSESMVDEFALTKWGVAATPLIVDDTLIVNVCGKNASLLALQLDSLSAKWKSPGQGTGYASSIYGTFGGRRQIVGYQSQSLSGWAAESGELLWNVVPEYSGDFNVPTPVAVGDDRLLVVTENNGMRLYRFDSRGILSAEPIEVNEDILQDTVTPISVNGHAYCTSGDELVRADLNDGLTIDWRFSDGALVGHASLIADVAGQRLLLLTYSGELMLFDISGAEPELISQRSAFLLPSHEEIYSHPAVVGNRAYIRGIDALHCVAF
jgi:outer membrane protein assembly factor BamB